MKNIWILAAVIVLLILLIFQWERNNKEPGVSNAFVPGTRGSPGPHGEPGPLYREADDISRDVVGSMYTAAPNFGMTAGDQDSDQPHSWSYFPDKPETRSVLYSTADVDPIVTGQLYAWRDYTRDTYANRTALGDKYGLSEYSSGIPGEVGVDVGPLGLAEYSAPAYPVLSADGRLEHYGGVEWSRDIGLGQSGLVTPGFDRPGPRSPRDLELAKTRFNMAQGYVGRSLGYNDGVPENWRFPSTPVRWYGENYRDYFGPEGPTVASQYGPPFAGGSNQNKRKLYSLTEPDHDPGLGPDPDAEVNW